MDEQLTGIKTEELIDIIKKDDLSAFTELSKTENLGTLKFGRFPLLTTVYLFSAKKIAMSVEEQYIKITTFRELKEPMELSETFSKKAGKATRLYADETVSPLEMLVILGNSKKVKELYPSVTLSAAQKERMQKAYSMTYGVSITYFGNEINIEKRPLTRPEKRRILIAALSTFLCLAIIISTPFVVNVFVPFIGVDKNQTENNDNNDNDKTTDNQTEERRYIYVSSFSEVNMSASDCVYVIDNDIVLPESSANTVLECGLDLKGHNISSSSFPCFGKISGSVENAVLSVNRNFDVSDNLTFLATENTGEVTGITISYTGNINVTESEDEEKEQILLCGMFKTNSGKIKNCTVSLNATIVGEKSANALFTGICALNEGTVSSCSVTGTVTSTDTDLSGICEENAYLISECTVDAELTQNVTEREWYPIVCGVAVYNYGTIYKTENKKALTITDLTEKAEEETNIYAARCAGICLYTQYNSEYGFIPDITLCVNRGDVTTTALSKAVYASGLTIHAENQSNDYFSTQTQSATLSNNENHGKITAETSDYSAYASGLAVSVQNTKFAITSCVNSGEITAHVISSTYERFCEVISGGLSCYLSRSSTTSLFATSTSFSSCRNTGNVSSVLDSEPASSFAVYSGGISALAQSTSLTSCSNSGNIASKGYATASKTASSESSYIKSGGLVADGNSSVFLNALNEGNVLCKGVDAIVQIGGVAGVSSQQSGCVNKGRVEIADSNLSVYGGGIVGYCSSSITNAKNNGVIVVTNRAEKQQTQQQTPEPEQETEENQNATDLSAKAIQTDDQTNYTLSDVCIGGIAGYSSGSAKACLNTSKITANLNVSTSYAGGIFGAIGGRQSVESSSNSGEIDLSITNNDGTTYVGGIVSYGACSVTKCENKGNIKTTGGQPYVGGILGYLSYYLYASSGKYYIFSGSVSKSISSGNINVSTDSTSRAFIGGACAYVSEYSAKSNDETTYFGGSISDSFAIGSITFAGTNAATGGLVGAMGKHIFEYEKPEEGAEDSPNNHIENNFFLSTSPYLATGCVYSDDNFEDGGNKGAEKATSETIKAKEEYSAILSEINSALNGTEAKEEESTTDNTSTDNSQNDNAPSDNTQNDNSQNEE